MFVLRVYDHPGFRTVGFFRRMAVGTEIKIHTGSAGGLCPAAVWKRAHVRRGSCLSKKCLHFFDNYRNRLHPSGTAGNS